MNRSILLVALATGSSFAASVKLGGDALVGYNILAIGSDIDAEANPSFGGSLGPTVAVNLTPYVSIGGGVFVQYDMMETEQTVLGQTFTHKQSKTSVALQVAPIFHVNNQVSIKAGYEWDMPLTGSDESEYLGIAYTTDVVPAPDDEADLYSPLGLPEETGVVSTHNLVLGASFLVMPNLSVSLQGKYALNGAIPNYDGDGKLDGAAGSDSNIGVHQVAIGLSYAMDLRQP